MKTPGRLPVVLGMIVSLASWFTLATPSPGADPPVQKMLDGLRQNRYYDMAIPYLEQMREHPGCPADFKDRIDYEIGVTLLEAAEATETVSQRETTLDQATAAIQKFLKEHPTHELTGPSSTQLGRVLLRRGAGRVQQAELPGVSPDDKNAKLAEARKFFDEAQSALEAAENRCYEKAKKIQEESKANPTDTSKADLEEAYGELLQARLLLINNADQKARTYAPDSKEFKEQLLAAAKRYAELFEKNEERIGGLQARNFEGKIYADLEQNDKAAEIFRETLSLPDASQTIRNLRRQAFLWLMETLLKPAVKKYDEAIAAAAQWKEEALPNEQASPEGLRIQLLAGQACLEAAKALDPKDEKRRTFLRSARGYLEFVQRASGAIQQQAGNLLMDELLGGAEMPQAEPKTFEEAFEQASGAWLKMVAIVGRMGDSADPKESEALAGQAAAARRSITHYSQLALGMAGRQTNVSQLCSLRFYLAFVCFVEDRLYDAAVLGELLAYRYPQSKDAPKGAEIAVKAYRRLFDIQRRAGRDTAFELANMQRVALYVTGRWKDDPAAAEAWAMLFDTAADLQDLPKATEYLEKLAPESPQRSRCELRLGQTYWTQYVRLATLDKGQRPSQEELDALVKKAQDTLRQGIDRLSKAVDAGGEVDYSLACAVLALAQILIDAGNAEEAAHWLDDPKIGPMTLIAANHPAVAGRTDFQIDTYKVALRACVGTEKIQQAEAVMAKLETLVGHDDEEGAARLTQIYISLGRQLEEVLARLRAEGKSDQIQKVSLGFEKFLDTISKREKGNSFTSLNWVAQTFASMAAGLDPGDGPLPEAAVKYYGSAGATYYKLLKNPPADMREGAETAIKVQLAVCLRALGRRPDAADPKKAEKNFTQALGLLVEILKQKETLVNVQMEAARTYQELAAASGQPTFYLNAISGGQKQPDGHYLVWGWNGISRRVGSGEKYRDILYEARYNIALCRMRIAQTQTGQERADTLKLAENDIVVTHKLYPTLGGAKWFEKFDALLKAIRKFQGNDNPNGLEKSA